MCRPAHQAKGDLLHQLRRPRQPRLPYRPCLARWLYYACCPCRFSPAQNPNPYPYHKTRGAPAAFAACMRAVHKRFRAGRDMQQEDFQDSLHTQLFLKL